MGYIRVISPEIGSGSSTVITIKKIKGLFDKKDAIELLSSNATEIQKNKDYKQIKIKKIFNKSKPKLQISYYKNKIKYYDILAINKNKVDSFVIYSSSTAKDYLTEKRNIQRIISSVR